MKHIELHQWNQFSNSSGLIPVIDVHAHLTDIGFFLFQSSECEQSFMCKSISQFLPKCIRTNSIVFIGFHMQASSCSKWQLQQKYLCMLFRTKCMFTLITFIYLWVHARILFNELFRPWPRIVCEHVLYSRKHGGDVWISALCSKVINKCQHWLAMTQISW